MITNTAALSYIPYTCPSIHPSHLLSYHSLSDNMLRFDFPSPPPASHLIAALDELFALGAIGEDGQLTRPLGQNMAELPLPPQLAKMLLVSGVCVFGVEGVKCFTVRMFVYLFVHLLDTLLHFILV